MAQLAVAVAVALEVILTATTVMEELAQAQVLELVELGLLE
jgi:hypothetical protein